MSETELKEEIEKAEDFFAPEPLIPELQMCLTKTPDGTPWLRNYLVNQPWYTPALNKQSNLTYKHKLERIQELERAGEHHKILFYYERPWRLEGFLKYQYVFTDETYWESLASVWIDAENPNRNKFMWLILFQASRSNRHLLMDEDERKHLHSLPSVFTIYRGALPIYRSGLSWTLNKERAAWFSTRWHKRGKVYQATVMRQDVLAYFSGRNEEEIIVNPKKLKNIKPLNAQPQRGTGIATK